MDRGQVYKLDYLGNTTVSKFAGLPSLQKPLRDIYALHMKFESQREQRNIASTALQTTDEGLYVRFRRGDAKVKAKGAYTDEEVFYPAPSILLWEAVSFVHVTADKKGKKIESAFEPIEKDPTMKVPNLFSSLDKKYHFLLSLDHPALFVCVLRRSRGSSKPITDLHVWRCADVHEALEMNMLLDHVQAMYASNQSKRTAVFDYNPQEHGGTSSTSSRSGSSLVGGGGGGGGGRGESKNVQRSQTFTDDVNDRQGQGHAYAQSSLGSHHQPKFAASAETANYGSNDRFPRKQHVSGDEAEMDTWERLPQGKGDRRGNQRRNSGDISDEDTEGTLWHYRPTDEEIGRYGPSTGSNLSKSNSMMCGKSGSSDLLTVSNKNIYNGGSREDLDSNYPPRLPRVPLQSQHAARREIPDDYDPVYANRNEIPLSYDQAYPRREEAQSKQREVVSSRQAEYSSNLSTRPNVGNAPKSQDYYAPPSNKNLERQKVDAATGLSSATANTPLQYNDSFFLGMNPAAKKPNANDLASSSAGFGGGKDRVPTSPNSKIEVDDDYRSAPQPHSNGAVPAASSVDRVSRAKQLAAESRLLAQYPDSEPSSLQYAASEVDRDLYPVGPALKMLDTGSGDRPVARIPPHKSHGVQVLPGGMKNNNSEVERSPGLRRAETEYHGSGSRKVQDLFNDHERLESSGNRMYERKPNASSGNNHVERSKSALYPRDNQRQPFAANNNRLYDNYANDNYDEDDGNVYSKTQKKRDEIAATVGNIEIDNMRSTMKPMGRVNLEESLGYFP